MSQNEKNAANGVPEPLTLFQRQEAASLCRHIIETVGLYLAGGIELSVRQKNVSDEVFWDALHQPTDKKGKKRIMDPKWEKDEETGVSTPVTPEMEGNPYGAMDFQACAKYLAFGWGRERKYEHSRYYCDLFSVDEYHTEGLSTKKYKGPHPLFQADAHSGTFVRNRYMHMNRNTLLKLSRSEIQDDIKKLKKITEALKGYQERHPEETYGGLMPLREFWEKVDLQRTKLLEEDPITIKELGQDLFRVLELSDEQRDALVAALAYLGISEATGRVCDGVIYKEASQSDLAGKLKYVAPLAQMLGGSLAREEAKTPEEAAEKWEREKTVWEEERKRVYPAPAKPTRKTFVSTGLEVSAASARLGEEECAALIDRFNIVLDDSVLLDSDGRNGIEKALIPALKSARSKEGVDGRKTFIKMDDSAVSALFDLFRRNARLSDRELEELGEDGMEEQERRSEIREVCKKAIGNTLSSLKRENCLKVNRSPLGDETPRANLCRAVEMAPDKQFLVLTVSEGAARKLGELPARNVVAGRLVRDMTGFTLEIFDATRQNWVEIMGLETHPTDPKPEDPSGGEERKTGQETSALVDALVGEHFAPTAAAKVSAPAAPAAAVKVTVPAAPAADVDVAAPAEPAVDEESLVGAVLRAIAADGREISVTLGRKIGFGGEGVIYAASGWEGEGSMAVKIYKTANRTPQRLEKLKYMLANDPAIEHMCWPRALVCSGDEWLGFLMPMAEGEVLAYTVYNPGENAGNIREKLGWDRKDLVQAAENIADLFDQMHRRGILMGDINPRNILVGRDSGVWFVDCDSYQMGDFLCPVGMLRYIPPAVLRRQVDGNVDYRFRRTEKDEEYSLAVLLFEVLMLGKPPYVSKTNNPKDVRQAVMDGIFPYRFETGNRNSAEEEEEERDWLERMGILAPAGIWQTLWNNTTYQTKVAFVRTFREKTTQSAALWKQTMQQYIYEIGRGHSSDELIPRSFKIPPDKEAEWLVCEECGEKFRMLKSAADALKAKGEPIYCYQDLEMKRGLDKMRKATRCRRCKKFYTEKLVQLLDPDFEPLCDDCGSITVKCAHCGESFPIRIEKKAELDWRGRLAYCDECQLEMVTCGQCQKRVRKPRVQCDRLRREGEEILCRDCVERQRRSIQ